LLRWRSTSQKRIVRCVASSRYSENGSVNDLPLDVVFADDGIAAEELGKSGMMRISFWVSCLRKGESTIIRPPANRAAPRAVRGVGAFADDSIRPEPLVAPSPA